MEYKMEENLSKGFVVKSNSLIEARYRLSLQESQIDFLAFGSNKAR